MASKELLELWAETEADLLRARSLLPGLSPDHPTAIEFTELLGANELGLACEVLDDYAQEQGGTSEFWQALYDAASRMNLLDLAREFERRSKVIQM